VSEFSTVSQTCTNNPLYNFLPLCSGSICLGRVAKSALAALSYLNLYSLLSSLYIISRFYPKFPFLLTITRYHSKARHVWSSCAKTPPLYHPPFISSLVLPPASYRIWGAPDFLSTPKYSLYPYSSTRVRGKYWDMQGDSGITLVSSFLTFLVF